MIVTDAADCGKKLLEVLDQNVPACFYTGAGISTPSGIPDFRSSGGIWQQYRIVELRDFENSEEARLEDWERRFHMAEYFQKAKPNSAHYFIVDRIKKGLAVGVITQNIDGLHRVAGLPDDYLVEFHGTGSYAHCLSCKTRYEMAEMEKAIEQKGKAPRCTKCHGLIKAAVISFGESIPDLFLDRALRMIDSSKIIVAIGSSLAVWPAAGLLKRGLEQGASLIIVNNDETPFDPYAQLILRNDIAQIFDLIKLN